MVETRSQRLLIQRLDIQRRWEAVEGARSVFIDILSRLPLKSSRSFKRVNRYWHESISNKYFAKQQFARSKERPSFISCPRMNQTMRLFSVRPKTFEFPYLNSFDPAERCDTENMYMISSFNGLICCINHIDDEDKFKDLQIWICNPCTGETLLLPQGRPSLHWEPSVGVAFGSDMSDYKVFRIYCVEKKIPLEVVHQEYVVLEAGGDTRDSFAWACEVYSSSTGAWLNLGPVPCVPMRSYGSPFRSVHVCVRGKIYWLVRLDDPGTILSVDWEGKFEVIMLPEYEDDISGEDGITDASFLIVLQESLALVVLHAEDMDIWIWKEDNEKSSWVFLHQDTTEFEDLDVVLTMTSSKNQILCVTQTHWYSYDLDKREWNKKKANKAGFVNPAVYPFTESLLPCDGDGGMRLLKEQ